ncbi:MAG: phytanoyl-CoA dioxygenase family protein [Planctomycetaceae bacterium]|nr:phytanoyl-CoA dioxygenase family protein [Planctomycetaceae bacterium]
MNPSVTHRDSTPFSPPDSHQSAASLAAFFRREGYALLEDVLTPEQVATWIERTEKARTDSTSSAAVSNSSGVYALRNLVDVIPEATELLQCPALAAIVNAVLGPSAFLIRSTLFDKTDGANWGVFWHQDLAIAVTERHDVPGFHAWTRKAGVVCVQPPTEVLSQILTVRLSLDPCHANNGALKVLPGSHKAKWNSGDIDQMTNGGTEVLCETGAGGAVLMSPLTLHASSPMNVPGHRRVIHLEFAAQQLPHPLEWNYRLPICLNDTTPQ